MALAYIHSESIDQGRRAAPETSASRYWSSVADYELDRGGPTDRPFHSMGATFADIPAFDHLTRIAIDYSGKPAIDDGVIRLTYAQFHQSVISIACRLLDLTLEGQLVAIFAPNNVWHVAAMFACLATNRPCLPLNIRDPEPRLLEIIDDARPVAILGCGDSSPTRLLHWIDIVESVARKNQLAERLQSTSVDVASLVLYTSGSTGRPKGVVNSQRSLLRRVQQYVDACHINASDIFCPLTGPATIAGCREILAALLSGATLHLIDVEAIGLRGVLNRMQSSGATISYATPSLLRSLMSERETGAFKLLRIARIGGEKITESDLQFLRGALGDRCLIQIGYSSTETVGAQWFATSDVSSEASVAPVGFLLPGLDFMIVDEKQKPVRSGQCGELVIKSRYVLLGHWQNGALAPADVDPINSNLRIFPTGDIVRLGERNLLHIVGRKGRQIKINGRRVEPAELEYTLKKTALIRDAVAIVTSTNELIAFVTPEAHSGAPLLDRLRDLMRATLPASLRPSRLHEVSQIPRLPGGKVDLKALEEIDATRREETPRRLPRKLSRSESAASDIVNRVWTKALNAPVAVGRWDEAGGDSLTLLHCVMEIENLIGRELDLGSFTVDMRIEEMIKVVSVAQSGLTTKRLSAASPPVLFLLPGSVGYGPSLASFAAAMGQIARVSPIRYPALQAILTGQDTLAAIADNAIQQIRRVQPSGHIRLLGHSLGGAVAFEVASRLLAAGRSVKFVGILDTSITEEQGDYRETIFRTLDRIRTNRVTASRMACRALAKITVRTGQEARLARMLDRFAKGEFNATCFRIKLELQEVLRARSFFAWLAGPKPSLSITGTLFRCARTSAPESLGWDRAFSQLDVLPIAGGHLDLVIEPHLAINRPIIERAVTRTYSVDEAASAARAGDAAPE